MGPRPRRIGDRVHLYELKDATMKILNGVKGAAARQRGQGMVEYIIIVALIAIAAIGVYTAFGGVIRGQTATMASELAGVAENSRDATGTKAAAAKAAGDSNKNLSNYESNNRPAGGAGGGGAPAPQ